METVFRAADLDGDGVVGRREAARAMLPAEAFAEADVDRDGFLDAGEFRALYRHLQGLRPAGPARRVEGELARLQALRHARRDSGSGRATAATGADAAEVLARLAREGALGSAEARALDLALEPGLGGVVAEVRDQAFVGAWARELIERERRLGNLTDAEAHELDRRVLAHASDVVRRLTGRAEPCSATGRAVARAAVPGPSVGPSALRRVELEAPRD